jgi:putative protease
LLYLEQKLGKVLKKVELLSPAGNFEKLKIALAYGADAVYGGVSHFSLRIRSSKEFTYESFGEAVEYTHSLGKKIYVTINGFPFNNQLKLLESHLEKMAALKPDAFIISTPGVISLAKKVAPDIPLHLSTQANVLNYLDAKFYYDQGVERIIAAREISLRDLEEIKKYIPDLELEVFVHGSMCFAYSGRCLVSAVQMGRVPNRGSCANDCRFEYTLYAENKEHGTLFRLEEQPEIGTYIFNAKDMNLASHVDEILKSGVVDSLKIEGRTKSAYYTAITAKTYREAIDDFNNHKFDSKKYQKELHTTKHRGFSDAYLISRPFEKNDTQKYDSAISVGSHEVAGLVREDGEYFMCKYKIFPDEDIEILLPQNTTLEYGENEIGKVFQKDKINYIRFYKILTEDGKELQSVHSGNTNPIKLPMKLPSYSIFRKEDQEV